MGEGNNGFLSSFPCFAIYFGNKRYNTIWKMPSVLLSDYLAADLAGPEQWPEEILMFTPIQDKQILLYESANCRAVETFFKMAGISYEIEQRANAEFMSPSNKVPLVACGSFILTELERIAAFFREKGQGIGNHLNEERERPDMRTYLSPIKTLVLAELYICWHHELTYQTLTKKRYSSVHSFPLNYILPWRKRREVLAELAVFHWNKKTLNDVYKEVDRCLRTFSDYLSDKTWFFGGKPTEVDALLYGHLFGILTTNLPDSRLADIVSNYSNLIEFYERVQREFFESPGK